ncbi:cell division protein FtsL [Candidatus Profftia tarda]|uniref:Cell division protein FtsL n=1 Tax=Candidatus Profftia tarda TaxID=1177216 RepID=A0A8E4EY37_9ENTR|nr:cell division protein FtsL [Candidatus Profftia tarda]CAD6508507.1 Cell division protein FtsL [Candidatus Profftia tarda]
MNTNKRYTLVTLIRRDILSHCKMPLFLFIILLISAICVVMITYKTRVLTAQREKLAHEHDALDTEWRNLILEDNALADHKRLEQIAKQKLNMDYVDPTKEKILVQQ